jgi:ATP-binding cassette subfamily B protein
MHRFSAWSAVLAMRTLRGYRRYAGIAWQASPRMVTAAVVATLVAALAPLASLVVVGALVGHIPAVISGGLHSPAGHTAVLLAIATTLLFAVQWGVTSVQTTAATATGDRVDFALQRRLIGAVMAPAGISHLEDPRSVDLITVGRSTFRGWIRPGRLALALSQLINARLTLLGACVILVRFSWLLALVMLAAAIWAEYEAQLASRRGAEHHYGSTPLARRTEYFYELGVTPAAAKEIRIFGLADFLVERFSSTWQLAVAGAFSKERLRTRASAVVLVAATLLTTALLSYDASRGHLGLTLIMVYAQAIMLILASVSAAAAARLECEMALGTLDRYYQAMDALEPVAAEATASAQPAGAQSAGAQSADGRPEREIRFEQVSFHYPGTSSATLNELDLVIPAGQSLAIVGDNGAGKTTLIKLLCRLYEPDSGRITVDGTSLTDLDLVSWRHRIAPVFQDYVRYQLSASSNIGLGFAPAQDDQEGLAAAAEEAGATAAIGRLPHGWDTILSADYTDGVDLSGGEWQKVALARALFALRHGASVLVLDEPAANLDARSEARLYEHFLALTAGITSIIVSHRFSTVRQASRIVVIRDGQVAEQGSHDELLARDGHYARMFLAQASRFDDSLVAEQGARP